MRLIDADKLIEELKEFVNSDIATKEDKETAGRIATYIEAQASVVDAELVKHGRWINVNRDGSLWKCSICGETQCCKSNYCGDCGAKMDRKVECGTTELVEEAERLWKTVGLSLFKQMAKRAVEQIEKEQSSETD